MQIEINEIWHNKEKSWIKSLKKTYLEEKDVLVKVIYSMISLGTERTIITQNFSNELSEQMAVPYMKGSLMDAFTYGYSVVGEVISGPEFWIGKNVHLMHPHQDFIIVSEDDLVEVPEGINLKSATLASNLETAVNAIWDSEVAIGDKVLVFGYGLIGGLIAALVNQIPGVNIEVAETNNHRKRLHLAHGLPERSMNDYDIIFNSTCDQKALQEALSLTRHEGKIIELSWYGSKNTTLNLGSEFHYGRKQIISSQVSHIPYKKLPVWNYTKRKQLVFDLIAEIEFSYLLDNEINFKATPEFYKQLRRNEIKNLSTIICY